MTDEEKYHELLYYTLTHQDPEFIHQYAVDAYAAQTANDKTKPIKVAFGLMGLYLRLEKGFTGREVQRAHMDLAKKKLPIPTFKLPENRGNITISGVINMPAGTKRDEMIELWIKSVWDAYRDVHKEVANWLEKDYFN